MGVFVPGDVLIISRPEDPVSRRLETALTARGHSATWLDGPAAARLFTIRVTDAGSQVVPEVPMFVRPVSWWDGDAEADPDARFLRNECFATFWAAAALSGRAVINRPTPGGPVYRLTAGYLTSQEAGRGEIHASGPEQIAEGDDAAAFCGENAEYRVGALATLPADVPVRARRVDGETGYEIVTVVGGQALPATTDARSAAHDLAARSLKLARHFGVQFATVTWAVTEDMAEAVRLNPTPYESELRYRWADVLDALCCELLA
jgi:hypothetical protein